MNVVLRRAAVGDAAAVAAVHAASLLASHRGLVPAPLAHLVLDPPEAARRTPGWRRCLLRSRVDTVVACVDGAVAGFCTLRPLPGAAGGGRSGELWALFVRPSHWRRGLGRLLCERSLADARSRSFAEVALWVLEPNERARRFYRALGFRPDGETRIFLERAGVALRDLRYRRTAGGPDGVQSITMDVSEPGASRT